MLTPASPSHQLSLRVYYEDTDAAGVVYYANYLKFCERARTEWLRAVGFVQQELRQARGLVFVVRSLSADYLRSAELDDLLVVKSSVSLQGRTQLVFAQTVWRGDERLFAAQVGVVCVDWAKRKPTPLPADIRQALECIA